MKKLSFAILFKIFVLISIVFFLYFLSIIAINLKTIAENSENGRYLSIDGSVLDSRTGKVYIVKKFESFEDKGK